MQVRGISPTHTVLSTCCAGLTGKSQREDRFSTLAVCHTEEACTAAYQVRVKSGGQDTPRNMLAPVVVEKSRGYKNELLAKA